MTIERKDIGTVLDAHPVMLEMMSWDGFPGECLILRDSAGKCLAVVQMDDVYDEDGNRFTYF